MTTPSVNKKFAHIISFIGLLPFLLLALGCWTASVEWLGYFIRGQFAYSIAILSFLGGMHWGGLLMSKELSAEQSKRAFVWSVLPTIIAWSSTLMGGFGFAVLMIGFIGAYQADKRLLAWYGMPDWLLGLRFRMTFLVVTALVLTVLAANVRG